MPCARSGYTLQCDCCLKYVICSRFSTFMHLIANIMVDRIFVRRTFVLHVFERFTDSVNSFFSHVGIEHAFVEFHFVF